MRARTLTTPTAGAIDWTVYSAPTAAPPLETAHNVSEIAAGFNYLAVRTAAGSVILQAPPRLAPAAASNSDLLGPASGNDPNVTAIASGADFLLAMTDQGQVLCTHDTVDTYHDGGPTCAEVLDSVAASAGGSLTARAIRASMWTAFVQLNDADGTWISFRPTSLLAGQDSDYLAAIGSSSASDRLPASQLADVAVIEDAASQHVLLATMSGGGRPLVLTKKSLQFPQKPAPLPAWLQGSSSSPAPNVTSMCVVRDSLAAVVLLANGSLAIWQQPGVTQLALPEALSEANVSAVACGYSHGVALLETGSTLALGPGPPGVGKLSPPLGGTVAVQAVGAGAAHSLFLSTRGNVYQTGVLQNLSPQPLPNALQSPLGIVGAVAAGAFSACAQLAGEGRGLVVWGDAQDASSDVPPDLASTPIAQVSLGISHATALLADGSVLTWGTSTLTPRVPLAVRGARISSVAAGFNYSVAIAQEDGQLLAWGQVPCDHQRWSLDSAARSILKEVTQISAWGINLVALLSNGTAVVNGCDQLKLQPQLVEHQGSIAQVAASLEAMVLLLKSGRVVALGKLAEYGFPEAHQGQVVSISAGHNHALALLKNGSVVAFGLDSVGAVSNIPPEVRSGRATAIAAGLSVSLAIVDPATIDLPQSAGKPWPMRDVWKYFTRRCMVLVTLKHIVCAAR
jgi:alpha-tubulin suppressor-like RCC1 family protein